LLSVVFFLLYRSDECPLCKTKVTKKPSRKAAKKQKAAESFEDATFYTGRPDVDLPPGATAKFRQNYEACVGNINNSQQVGTTAQVPFLQPCWHTCALLGHRQCLI
jgi:hypothetical protein